MANCALANFEVPFVGYRQRQPAGPLVSLVPALDGLFYLLILHSLLFILPDREAQKRTLPSVAACLSSPSVEYRTHVPGPAAMVLYYKTIDPSYFVYVGRDKHENEDLIKHGWDNDVWFHVDKLSSAHVYLRLKDGESIGSIPEDVIRDCAQLVKHNSIEGNKMSNVGVVYTMWGNLKKTGDMAVGQVSFHDTRAIKRLVVEKRVNEIVNRMNKTKTEATPDLHQEKTDRLKELNRRAREQVKRQADADKVVREQRQKEKQAKSYDSIHKKSEMTSNRDYRGADASAIEDDFM